MSATDDPFTETALAHDSCAPLPGYVLPLNLEAPAAGRTPGGVERVKCRTCFCGQRLMPFAIRCPSRQDCHVENVQKERRAAEGRCASDRKRKGHNMRTQRQQEAE